MPVNTISQFGWANCVQIINDHAELIVTSDVGPRVLGYRTIGGTNSLWVDEKSAGGTGERDFKGRGGHRLWVSPETERTYAPDNVPVTVTKLGANSVRFTNAAAAPWNLRKELTITLADDSSAVSLEHKITNEGQEPVNIASWALTIMAKGGYEIIPQPPLGEHGKEFLPNRVIVPWTYTDLSDLRWKFGRRFFLLTPSADGPSTKLGLAHLPGWVGWVRPGTLFLKAFPFEKGATYPDLGCNFETFTKAEFLELESLSPTKDLAQGESVGHTERWHLFDGITAPDPLDERALEHWLAPYLRQSGFA